jgi:hypothetical protein
LADSPSFSSNQDRQIKEIVDFEEELTIAKNEPRQTFSHQLSTSFVREAFDEIVGSICRAAAR